MTIGFIGLGKMGLNMVTRLQQGGHQTIVYDISDDAIAAAVKEGAQAAPSLAEMVKKLSPPRIVWVMVPAGQITESIIADLADAMSRGDIIIDGGNSNFHETIARGKKLAEQGISFLDAGTSGGVWGLEVGYCLMVGGEAAAFHQAEPIFKTLAPPDGYLHVGPSGSGHYVKMIHNGIEYAMMQAYAEGFEILEKSEFDLDLEKISHLWNQGSVIRSWLLELAERAFAEDPKLSGVGDWVSDSGEGRWTVLEAIDLDVPALAITHALMTRFRSRQEQSFSAKVLAALRNQFGGHAIKEVPHATK